MLLQNGIDFRHLLISKLVDSRHVLNQLVHSGTAGNGNNGGHAGLVAQGANPSQRNLRWGDVLARSQAIHLVDQLQVVLEVFFLEARHVSTEVTLGDVIERGDGAREDTAAKRRVGHDGDLELGTGLCNVVFQDVG